MAAGEVALLVADVGDDPVALALQRRPLPALEGDDRLAPGLEEDPGEVAVARVVEVLARLRLDRRRSARDCEHRDARGACLSVEIERGGDGWRIPGDGRERQRGRRLA